MTNDYLQLILDYHYWARDRLLAAVEPLTTEQYDRPLGNSFTSVRDTLNHLLFAEWVWQSRWDGVSPSVPPDDRPADLAALRERWAAQEGLIRQTVKRAGADKVIGFRNLAGVEGSAPTWQMVVHLVNHGSYHRGQVTTLLRQLGAEPPKSLDMMAYFREREG